MVLPEMKPTSDDRTPPSVWGTLGEVAVRVLCVGLAVVSGAAGVACAVVAAGFALRAFLNGWTPGRWFSGRLEDWVIGTGVEGDAGNYVGFITAAIPASICFTVAQWGIARATSSARRANH